MSYPTVPAYIQTPKGWESRLKEHPVFDWMYDHHLLFDSGEMKTTPYNVWHTDDFTFTKSDGVTIAPGEQSWAVMWEQYAPFTKFTHEPAWLVIWETATGWELTGYARLFANLPVPGESIHEDVDGNKWDVQGHGMFQFTYVKDPSGPKGIKMGTFKLFADPTPLFGEMIKRGMISGEDLLAKLA